MKHLVIINPKSFAKEAEMMAVISDIVNHFKDKGLEYHVHVSRYPRDATGVVGDFVSSADKTVRVYSVGGDGILFDCLNGMARLGNAQLAAVPYGTSDDFMRSFGEGNHAVFRDIANQSEAGVIRTDVIKAGSRYCLNFCSIGFEGAAAAKYYAVSNRHPVISQMLGKSFYSAGILLALADKNASSMEYEVEIDGVSYNGTYFGIRVSNGPCLGGDKVPVPMAHPADGYLDVFLQNCAVNLSVMKKISDFTNGKYHKHPKNFTYFRAKEVTVRSDKPMFISSDGEFFFDSELKIKIIPAAVSVVAPKGLEYVRREEGDIRI